MTANPWALALVVDERGRVRVQIDAAPSPRLAGRSRSLGGIAGSASASTNRRADWARVDAGAYDSSVPPRVNQLIFIVHGIGRHDDFDEDKCTSWDGTAGLRTGGNNEFRSTVRRLLDDHFGGLSVHVEVRAIEWHSRLRAHGLDQLFGALTTMPAGAVSDMRNFAGEYLMDVLYYVQPLYGQSILDEVAQQLNAAYARFRAEHPLFDGGVSIVGHSLGSMIVYDLLGGGDGAGRGYRAPTVRRPPLAFEVEHFFAIGSPIAAFLISRGCRPPPAPERAETPAPNSTPPDTTPADADGAAAASAPQPSPPQPPQPQPQPQLPTSDAAGALDALSSARIALHPRCAFFWSIFHGIDPVAQRLEPLMRHEPRAGGWPAEAPRKVERARQLPKASGPSRALLELLVGAASTRRVPVAHRVDWLLPKQSTWVSDNLFALPAHSSYWANDDCVLFVLAQLCAPVGEWLHDRARQRLLDGRLELPPPAPATAGGGGGGGDGSGKSSPVPSPLTPLAASSSPVVSARPKLAPGASVEADAASAAAAGSAALESVDGYTLLSLMPSTHTPLDRARPLDLCCRMLLHDNLTGQYSDHLVVCQDGLLRLFDPAVAALVVRKGSIDLRGAEVAVGSDSAGASGSYQSFGYATGYGTSVGQSSLFIHTPERRYEMACATAADADGWFVACKEAQDAYARARAAAGGAGGTNGDGGEQQLSDGEEDEAVATAAAAATSGALVSFGSGGCTEALFNVARCGSMRKRGHPSKVLVSVSWTTRYFCLAKGGYSLEYYDKEPDWLRRADVRTLPLRGCRIELIDDVLAVRVKDGRGASVLLRANTAADFARWAPFADGRVPTAATLLRAGGRGGGGGGGGSGGGSQFDGRASPADFAAAAAAMAFTGMAEQIAGSDNADPHATGAAAGWAHLSFLSRRDGPEGADGRGARSLATGCPHVSVDGYKVLTEGGRQYVGFVLRSVCANGATCIANRRFSDFVALNAQLQALPASAPAPSLPPTRHIWNRFDPAYLQEKGVLLGDYLNQLVERCFVAAEPAEAWVEPLLRFLAMPARDPGRDQSESVMSTT